MGVGCRGVRRTRTQTHRLTHSPLQAVAPAELHWPAGHTSVAGDALVAPGLHVKPAEHGVHELSPLAANLPAGHMSRGGLDTTAPGAHANPASQLSHVPPCGAHFPAGHMLVAGVGDVLPAVHE